MIDICIMVTVEQHDIRVLIMNDKTYIADGFYRQLMKEGYAATAAYLRAMILNGELYVSNQLVRDMMDYEKGLTED